MSKQQEMPLPKIIDTHEKLVSVVCEKLRESWVTPDEKQKLIAEEVIQIVLSSRHDIEFKRNSEQLGKVILEIAKGITF